MARVSLRSVCEVRESSAVAAMADGQDSLGMSGVRSTFSDRSSDQVQVMLHRNNRLHGQLLPGAQRAAAELGADDTNPMSHSAPAPALSQVPLELSGSCVATTSRRSAGLKRSVLAGSRPPSALPTTSLGRSAHTNAPHEGCTHAGPGRTRRFRAQSQHRIQSVFMHGSAAKQPY